MVEFFLVSMWWQKDICAVCCVVQHVTKCTGNRCSSTAWCSLLWDFSTTENKSPNYWFQVINFYLLLFVVPRTKLPFRSAARAHEAAETGQCACWAGVRGERLARVKVELIKTTYIMPSHTLWHNLHEPNHQRNMTLTTRHCHTLCGATNKFR